MRAVASTPPCFAARLPDVFAGKVHVDVAFEYTVAEDDDNLALDHHAILRGSLASPHRGVEDVSLRWCTIHSRCNMKI
jgi:hypothetical protein